MHFYISWLFNMPPQIIAINMIYVFFNSLLDTLLSNSYINPCAPLQPPSVIFYANFNLFFAVVFVQIRVKCNYLNFILLSRGGGQSCTQTFIGIDQRKYKQINSKKKLSIIICEKNSLFQLFFIFLGKQIFIYIQ